MSPLFASLPLETHLPQLPPLTNNSNHRHRLQHLFSISSFNYMVLLIPFPAFFREKIPLLCKQACLTDATPRLTLVTLLFLFAHSHLVQSRTCKARKYNPPTIYTHPHLPALLVELSTLGNIGSSTANMLTTSFQPHPTSSASLRHFTNSNILRIFSF